MIVRDEQATLPRCLASAAAAVDAIYLTDTGSTDATVTIAKQYGAHIRHYPWSHDFSAARNHSIQAAKEDWLLILDADDCFPAGEAARLKPWLATSDALALTLEYTVMAGYSPAPTRRVLRNHRGLRFTGFIHESVRASLPAAGHHTVATDVQLQHLGYSEASWPVKLQRNLPLLQKEWERCQSAAEAGQRLLTGKELAYALIQLGQPAEGEKMLVHLLAAWPGGDTENQFATEALGALLFHYHATGRDEAAWTFCEHVRAKLAAEPAYSLYRGLAAFHVRHFAEALTQLTAFEQHWLSQAVKIPVPLAYTGLALWDLQGQCHLHMNRAAEAARLFTRCLEAGGDVKEYGIKLHLARQLAPS